MRAPRQRNAKVGAEHQGPDLRAGVGVHLEREGERGRGGVLERFHAPHREAQLRDDLLGGHARQAGDRFGERESIGPSKSGLTPVDRRAVDVPSARIPGSSLADPRCP
jgi:hypothetical protein